MSRKKSDKSVSDGFAERMKALVKNNAKFSELIGVSPETVRQYKLGQIPVADVLLNISKVTNKSMEWLLTGQEKPYEISDNLVEKRMLEQYPFLAKGKEMLIDAYIQKDVVLMAKILEWMAHRISNVEKNNAMTPEKNIS